MPSPLTPIKPPLQQTFHRRDSASVFLSFLIIVHLSLFVWSFSEHSPLSNTKLTFLIAVLNFSCRLIFVGYYLWWLFRPEAIYSTYTWRLALPWLLASSYKAIMFGHDFWQFGMEAVRIELSKNQVEHFVPACTAITLILISAYLGLNLSIYYIIVTANKKGSKRNILRRLIEYLFVPFERR